MVKRAFAFIMVEAFLGLVVISRLTYLQLFKFSHYRLLSDKNRLITKHILPSRGKILCSDDEVVASNKFSYSAVLDVSEVQELEKNKIISMLSKEMKLYTLRKRIATPWRNNKLILLQEDLDWEMLAKYYIVAMSTPSILIEKTESRKYLYPNEMAHVIGYTGAPTKGDFEKTGNMALLSPMAKIGKNCIEKECNDRLFGKIGMQLTEVNSRREFVRIVDHADGIPGDDIYLTINLGLQREVYRLLSEHESGSCVVMNVNTGAVLAFVSYPGYDINMFTKKINAKILNNLYEDPYKPMINKVISGLYAPGSVFKMVTALAGLHYGVINEDTLFHCSGVHKLGSHKFHCWKWKHGGHGSVNLIEALAESCDVYFYNVAILLGPDKIAKVANDFGLGMPTGIDLPHEKSGLIPTKSWKKNKRKQGWTKGDTLNMAIGQGFNLATPLQLVRMLSILVNGLKPVIPYIIRDRKVQIGGRLAYKEEHVRLIMDGMDAAVNSDFGTARNSSIDDDSFRMGGKTGSSQVCHITEEQRKRKDTVSKNYWTKEHSIFAGYAPVDSPKFAIIVLVEHGGGGGAVAAPIARDVLLAVRKYVVHPDQA
jgi:penicillin-binding protein 2